MTVKSSAKPQPATSLPRAPKEDAGKRSTTYLVMMAIRLVCLGLVLFVTPYSWYTWVFAAMAIFLPYLAVVIANVSADMTAPTSAYTQYTNLHRECSQKVAKVGGWWVASSHISQCP